MAADNVIQSFLVSLGVKTDDQSLKKFTNFMASAAKTTEKLSEVLGAATVGLLAFSAKIGMTGNQLYWFSKNTNSHINGLKALSYAYEQTGGSTQALMNGVSSIAKFLRSNPGAEGFLNRMGIATRNSAGQMLDTTKIFTELSQKLNAMPFYQANQFGALLGIDQQSLLAMRRNTGKFVEQYEYYLKKTGFSNDKAAKSFHNFGTAMNSLGAVFGILKNDTAASVDASLTVQIQQLTNFILNNYSKVSKTLKNIIKIFLDFGWALSKLAIFLGKVINAFSALDKLTGGKLGKGIALFLVGITTAGIAVKILKGVLFAVQLVISAFMGFMGAVGATSEALLATPFGWVLAGIAGITFAIYELIKSYNQWKETGKSGFWEGMVKAAHTVEDILNNIKNAFKSFWSDISNMIPDWVKNSGSWIWKESVKGFNWISSKNADAWNTYAPGMPMNVPAMNNQSYYNGSPIQQTVNVTVHGSNDPQKTADAVSSSIEKQTSHIARLVAQNSVGNR